MDPSKFTLCGLNFRVHTILAVSNWIFGIPPLLFAIDSNDYTAILVIIAAILASTGMHLSDAKEGRDPIILKNYSRMLLNVDRVVAWGAFVWILNRIKQAQIISVLQLYLLCIGMMCNGLSELIKNPAGHTIIHGIWHLCAYFGMGTIIVQLPN